MRGANGESISIESARVDRVECDWKGTLWLLEVVQWTFRVGKHNVRQAVSVATPPPPPALLEVSAGGLSRAIVKE